MLPNSASAAPIGKVAMLALCGHLTPGLTGRLFASHARCVLPQRRASRLDDPPESLPFA